jgi:hypothetical protein
LKNGKFTVIANFVILPIIISRVSSKSTYASTILINVVNYAQTTDSLAGEDHEINISRRLRLDLFSIMLIILWSDLYSLYRYNGKIVDWKN